MKLLRKSAYRKRTGAALILSMIFVLVFSALAVSMAQLSGANVQIADNHRKVNRALESAQSGLEITRHHLANISIAGSATNRLQAVAMDLQNNLTNAGITNVTATYDASTATINIASVSLDAGSNQTFSATITGPTTDTIQMNVIGINGQFSRQITTSFDFTPIASGVFDYGVASRSPLSIGGNASIEGLNDPSEADIYIESDNYSQALTMTGNAEIAGDVGIANSLGYADLSNNSEIGGESGQAAIDNHVSAGVDTIEFPVPFPILFEPYAVNIVDSTTTTSGDLTFQNIRVIANTNPNFSGNIILLGVIFVESPNQVLFSGNTVIIGVVVGNGDYESPNGSDQFTFTGNLSTQSVSLLPSDPAYDGLRELTGTFIMAPGFELNFSGNFNTMNGAIAGNGINFSGNAGGTITNSILNYSEDQTMTLGGNNTIRFDRSASVNVPSGFSTNLALAFQPTSYTEVTY